MDSRNYDKDVNKYRLIYDIHTHTTFSHGKGTIEDNVKAALAKGLSTIGIADHGEGHLFYGINKNAIPIMRKEMDRLKCLYPDIEILLGIEANIINTTGKLDISSAEMKNLDYVLAGYHYGVLGENPFKSTKLHIQNMMAERRKKNGVQKLRNANTNLVIRALYTNRIKVLTHPGDKGPFDLTEIAKACEETGTLMEISTWHEAPTEEELVKMATSNVRFIISSDAHTPDRVGTFIPGLKRALRAGIDPARIENLEEI